MYGHNGGAFLIEKRINKKQIVNNRYSFIVVTLLSISSISAFAVSTSWGLVLDRVDTSYFHSFVDKSDWSEVRKDVITMLMIYRLSSMVIW